MVFSDLDGGYTVARLLCGVCGLGWCGTRGAMGSSGSSRKRAQEGEGQQAASGSKCRRGCHVALQKRVDFPVGFKFGCLLWRRAPGFVWFQVSVYNEEGCVCEG